MRLGLESRASLRSSVPFASQATVRRRRPLARSSLLRSRPADEDARSVPRVPVIPALAPEIGGPGGGVADDADALDVLDPVLDRDRQPERGAVLAGERLAVHLPGE